MPANKPKEDDVKRVHLIGGAQQKAESESYSRRAGAMEVGGT